VLEWQGPAHFGEILTVEVGVVRYGNTSFDVGFVGTVAGRPVFTARTTCVSVTPVTLVKSPIPARVREKLGPATAMAVPQ
jgi:acyl-CoA thioesterase FadM